MSLSCSCDGFSDQDFTHWWWQPVGYSTMLTLRARKRCASCGELIDHGATVAEFERTRSPRDDYEAVRFGGGEYDDPKAIKLAPGYLCEVCADLYFSLDELGFYCVSPYENQRELVREYALVYGKKGDKDA